MPRSLALWSFFALVRPALEYWARKMYGFGRPRRTIGLIISKNVPYAEEMRAVRFMWMSWSMNTSDWTVQLVQPVWPKAVTNFRYNIHSLISFGCIAALACDRQGPDRFSVAILELRSEIVLLRLRLASIAMPKADRYPVLYIHSTHGTWQIPSYIIRFLARR